MIVIGAGLSGLNAALLLEEQGVDVQVLEGRQRVGGRVLSHRDVPGNPESGGTSFGAGYARLMDACKKFNVGTIDVTPIVPFFNDRELILDGKVIPKDQWATHPRNPFPAAFRQSTPWSYLNPVIGKNNPLKSADAWLDPVNAKYDVSLHQWLTSLGVSEDIIELCWNTNPNFGTTAHDVSAMMVLFGATFAMMQAQLGGKTFGYTAVGGNQAIPEAMAKGLKKPVRFGSNVTGIRSTSSGTEVQCADGTRVQGRLRDLLAAHDGAPPGAPGSAAHGRQGPRHQHAGLPAGEHAAPGRQEALLGGRRPQPQHLQQRAGRHGRGGAQGQDAPGHHQPDHLGAGPQRHLDGHARAEGRHRGDHGRLLPRAAGGEGQGGAQGLPLLVPGPVLRRRLGRLGAGPGHGLRRAKSASPSGRVHFCGEHTAVSNRGMEGAMESGERAAFEVLGLV